MGMNICMRSSNNPKIHEEYPSIVLNRLYNTFGCSHHIDPKDSDLKQIEKAFDVDLSPFKMFNNAGIDSYISDCESRTKWELKNAKTEEERKKIRANYKIEIIEARQKEADELENNWVDMSKLKALINELLFKFNQHPEYFDKLEFTLFTKSYFIRETENEENNLINKEERPYEDFFYNKKIKPYNIEEDFQLMLNFIDFAMEKGEDKISFFIM